MKRWYCIFIVLVLGLVACSEKGTEDYNPDTSYWSINQFIIDQYNLRAGTTSSITKVVNLNGTVDTTYYPFDQVDWSTIFKVFGVTDISHPKYYNKYTYENFYDNFMEMATLVYTAKTADQLVQKLNVVYNNSSGEIQIVYIETNDDGWFVEKQQKLSYYVGEKIVIQETQKGKFSDEKNVTVSYLF